MTVNSLKNTLVAHQKTVLASAILLSVALFSAICFWKYAYYQYNGIDLAYFSQVFWNTVQGRFFTQSIHPHLSLGDHAEFIIPLLAIPYALFRDPRTLLVLQSLGLALATVPLWLIARRKFPHHSLAPLAIALTWLASPFVQNITLFEFHILAFAPLPLFFAILEYEKGRRGHFLLWCVVALLIREDVTLVVAAISVLAWVEKKSWFWKIVPLALGAAWFVVATRVISLYAPDGSYKFLVYYSWLGATPLAMLTTALTSPLLVLKKIATLPNLEMLIGFGMPSLFFCFRAPRRLLLTLGPLAQILLGAPGGGELILRTHYATLFLPAIFLATTEALSRIRTRKNVFHLSFGVAAIYGMIMLGPIPTAMRMIYDPGQLATQKKDADALLATIEPSASVAASYNLLPNLSSRKNLYSVHYLFLGVNQFATSPYPTPKNLDYFAINSEDFLFYQTQFPQTSWTAPYAENGYSRLRNIMSNQTFNQGNFLRFGPRQSPNDAPTYPTPLRATLDNGMTVRYGNLVITQKAKAQLLTIPLVWSAPQPLTEFLTTTVSIMDAQKKEVASLTSPLPNFPLNTKELTASPFTTTLSLSIESLPPGNYTAILSVNNETSSPTLNPLGTIIRTVTKRVSYGSITFAPFSR